MNPSNQEKIAKLNKDLAHAKTEEERTKIQGELNALDTLIDLQKQVKDLLRDIAEGSPGKVARLIQLGILGEHESNGRDLSTPRKIAQAILEDTDMIYRRTLSIDKDIKNYKLFL